MAAGPVNLAAPPTSLDPEETPQHENLLVLPTAEALHAGPPLYRTRHAPNKHGRYLIYKALVNANTDPVTLHRYRTCGLTATLLRDKADYRHLKFTPITCKHRLCPACSRERATRIAQNLTPHVEPHLTKFITLTLRSQPEPLARTIARLRRAFATLRRRPLWQDRVRGYVAFLETKYSPRTAAWNAHLHVLAHSLFIPQGMLSQEWLACTGDSQIVDIRLARNIEDTTAYVTKYVTKALDAHTLTNPTAMTELAQTLRHAKLVLTGGKWRKLRLLAPPPSDTKWERVADVTDFLYDTYGDRRLAYYVRQAWDAYTRGTGPAEFIVPDDAPDPPPNAPDSQP